MAAQGFEYVPVDYGQMTFFGPGDGLDPTSLEFAEQYGFGWSTMMFDEGFEEEAGDFHDPNQEYIESLSEGAQEAYYEALYGSGPEFDASMTEEEMDQLFEDNPELFGPSGCEGEAWEESSSFGGAQQIWMEFGDQLDDLYERVQADPRIVEVERSWVECMGGKGHAFSSMDDMYMALDQRMQELWNSDYVDPLAGMTDEEIDALADEQLDDLFSGPDIDEEVLAEINAWEISLALDSFDCGGTEQ